MGILALGAVGPPGLARLRRLAASTDEAIRRTAMEGLGLQGSTALRDLEKAIDDPEVGVRTAAAEALSVWKMGSRSIPLLAIAMRDPEVAVRRMVVNSLGTPCMGAGCGDDYSAAVPVLGQALLDEDTMVRRSTVHQIDGFGTLAVPAVLRALDAPYPVCVEAAWTASSIGNDELQHHRRPAQGASAQLLPALIRRVQDPLCRPAALDALGRMSQLSAPHIVELVGDSDPEVAWSAVGLIGQLGDAATAMSPVLERLLQRPQTRERALEALAKTATALGRESIRIALDLLAHPTERWAAAELLGRVARRDEAVVLDLRASLMDPAQQEAAVVALGKAGSAARTALEDIDKLASAPSAPIREAARFAAAAIRASR
jgi:HEAT repeat protein